MSIFSILSTHPDCCWQGATGSASSSQEKDVQKRPPASPATARVVAQEAHVAGQTPIKSPAPKKSKVDSGSTKVDAYVENLMSKSNSPVAPPMDLTEEVVERELATPKSLEKEFQEAERLQATPEKKVDGDSVPWLKNIYGRKYSQVTISIENQHVSSLCIPNEAMDESKMNQPAMSEASLSALHYKLPMMGGHRI